MSLLNDMLRDLKSKERLTPSRVLGISQPVVDASHQKRYWALSFALLFMVSGAIFIYLTTKSQSVSPTVEKTDSTESPVETKSILPLIQFSFIPSINGLLKSKASGQLVDATPDFPETETQPSIKTSLSDVLNESIEALQNGEDPRAIALLSDYLAEYPDAVEVRENLAAIYLSHHAFLKGLDLLDEGLIILPYNLRLTMMKARFLVEQNHHKQALVLLQDHHPDMNHSPDFYGLLAVIYENLGRTSEAGHLYQSLTRVDPTNGRYWLGLAIALERQHNRQQAIEAYTRASRHGNSFEVSALAEERLKNLHG